MVSTSTIRAGTYGRDIEIDTKTDLSQFNVVGAQTRIAVRKPDGTETSWTATIKQPPSAGILTYTLQEGDVDVIGSYRLHAWLTTTTPPLVVYGDLAILNVTRLYEQRA